MLRLLPILGLWALVFCLMSALASSSRAQAPSAVAMEASDARVIGDNQRTRFVADFNQDMPLTVFVLPDPYRVVIDLPEVHFALPPNAGAAGRGLVSAFRYGFISKGKSRIVLDLTKPVAIDKSYFLPAVSGQPARMVIDLLPASREGFLAAAQKYRDEQVPGLRKVELPPIRPKNDKARIVVDPGHGGIDAGTVGSGGTLEKDVVLAFSKLLADKLTATGRYEVQLTRGDDSFLRLSERVDFARKREGDLFISIHADSYRADSSVRGAAVYTLSDKASDAMAASIAERENKSDILGGAETGPIDNEVNDILIDLTRRETRNFSLILARDLVSEFKPDIKLTRVPQQQASFLVLKAPEIPSALIELGFLSNREDEKLLKQADWQEKAALAMVRAIEAHFAARPVRRAGP